MIAADAFIERAGEVGFRLYSGVPCSYLTPLINEVVSSESTRYVGAANEGDAVAIAAGAQLGGHRAAVMFQNSGLGNAVSPLTSLTHTFRIPLLLIPTLRGEPGGPSDEPQHELMGQVTTDLLELMQIRWEYFPTQPADVGPALGRAVGEMDRTGLPYALVMRKGSVEPTRLRESPSASRPQPTTVSVPRAGITRAEALVTLQRAVGAATVVVATTGYTGRQLYALEDRPSQLYMVGSMGCAAGIGLGLAIACPSRRVVVIDGDGALLMRLGLLGTLGHERPRNLVHVLLDNGQHESTGGQATVSPSVDFAAMAAAAGYPEVCRVSTCDELGAELSRSSEALSFVHVPTLPGVPDGLPRPSIAPADVAARLRAFLAEDAP